MHKRKEGRCMCVSIIIFKINLSSIELSSTAGFSGVVHEKHVDETNQETWSTRGIEGADI